MQLPLSKKGVFQTGVAVCIYMFKLFQIKDNAIEEEKDDEYVPFDIQIPGEKILN